GTGSKFIVGDRNDTAARTGAVLDARNDFLSDVTAFVEVDAVELVHVGFVRESVGVHEIETAPRHPERDAAGFINLTVHQSCAELGRRFRCKGRRKDEWL